MVFSLPRIAVAAAVAALAVGIAPAHASCASQTVGSAVYTSCSDGTSGTSRTVGGTTYHSFGGQSGTSQTVGNTTYHSFGGQSGTSQTVGGLTYHSFGGQSGASKRVGRTR
ncbi:MAG: hypothetical protein ACREH3_20225, partial [Geminicoccales bacterium]